MRFRVLGTLEADDASGATLPVRSAGLRRLLALLLVHAGAVVSADRIADVLWGDDPPADPSNALHNLVFRLRRAVGGDVLVTRPPGYLLRLSSGATDAARFEDLVERARAVAADRPGDAAALLDEALSLWHGRAYAEFADEDFARVEAARLEELRVAANEDRVDIVLALGLPEDAALRAEQLVADHPMRERPHAQLMLALYRAGRQADALRVYQDYWTRIDEELGMEPSAALRRLQAEILRQDPTLDRIAPAVAVPARALESSPAAGNVPLVLTDLIGRERELASLSTILRRARLVTLVGVGGVGKTLLALHAAAPNTARFPDGAWVAELAAVSEPGMVGDAICTALGVVQLTGLSVVDRLVEYLRPKRLLLVVDNCEHLIDTAAGVVDTILRGCPSVTVLATSREPLGIDGEHLMPLAPLRTPPEGLADTGAAAAVPSVRLLLDRAAASAPSFALRRGNVAAVGEICRRLDGLPLAIELAAPKLRVMNPAEVVDRLDRRFPLLRSGKRIAAERQRTLWNVVDWSYQLLDDRQRRVFERLSVFAGSFTMAAAEHVCAGVGGGDIDASDVAALIVDLVDRSLLVAHVAAEHGETRYALLETLRAYGHDRLSERGEEQAARRAHARYAVAFLETAEKGLQGPEEARWADAVAHATGDLRAAHLWATGHDLDLATRLAAALFWYAELRVVSEMFEWAERTIAVAERAALSHPWLPAVYAVTAAGARFRGDFGTTSALAARGAALARDRSDRAGLYARSVLADVAFFQGRLDDAGRLFEDLVQDARHAGDRAVLTVSLCNLALARAYCGETDMAGDAAEQARQEACALGNPSMTAWALYSTAEVLLDLDPDRAAGLLDESITLARTVGGRYLTGVAIVSAASLHARHGDPARALQLFGEVLAHWHEAGGWTQLWVAMRSVVSLLARVGADDAAALLYGALSYSTTATPLFGADAERLAETVEMLTGRLGPDRFRDAVRQGAALSDDGAVVLASATIAQALAAHP